MDERFGVLLEVLLCIRVGTIYFYSENQESSELRCQEL